MSVQKTNFGEFSRKVRALLNHGQIRKEILVFIYSFALISRDGHICLMFLTFSNTLLCCFVMLMTSSLTQFVYSLHAHVCSL